MSDGLKTWLLGVCGPVLVYTSSVKRLVEDLLKVMLQGLPLSLEVTNCRVSTFYTIEACQKLMSLSECEGCKDHIDPMWLTQHP
jgi:hypothetical protein